MVFKRIVVPTDLSEPSFEGLRLGIEWARAFQAEIYMVHVIEVPAGGTIIAEAELIELLRKDAGKTLDQLQSTLPDIRVHRLIRRGHPARLIVACAAEVQADAIIMATHGRTGLSRVLLGSTTEEVVRSARCPVISVHRRCAPVAVAPTAGNRRPG